MGVTQGDIALPQSWYSDIEKSRVKAMKLLKKVIVLDMNDVIITGMLDDVSIDKLYKNSSPFCKVMLKKVKKYNLKEKIDKEMDEQIFFINKPSMIMDVKDIEKRFPNIYGDLHVEIRRGVY